MPFLDLLLIGLFDSVPQRLLSVVVVSCRASQLYKFGYDCAAAQSSKLNIVRPVLSHTTSLYCLCKLNGY